MLAETIGALRVLDRSRLIPRAALSALCACQIGLAWSLAQPSRHFVRVKSVSPDPSRNPLGTLCVSNRSRCGAVLILRLLAQPGHFGRVISPSSAARCWFCQRGLARRSWHGDLLQRGCAEILTRDDKRSFTEIFHRDLAKRSLLERLNRDLIYRSLTKILRGDFK